MRKRFRALALTVSLATSLASPAAAQTETLKEITTRINREHKTSHDRARAIYAWIAENIAYDVAGYLSGRTGDMSGEATFARRTAVCEGFANLFLLMARHTGVEAVKVEGYAKGFDYVRGAQTRIPNHAWIAFRHGRDWRLADPTWGAGYVDNQRFVRAFSWWYFDVSPAALQLSHHPERPNWQLVRRRMSRTDFERLAVVPRALLEAGFTPDLLRQAAAAPGHAGFPQVAPVAGVKLVSAPLQLALAAGAPQRLELVWADAAEVMVTSNGRWLAMQRDGDRHTLTLVPDPGSLMVVGRRPGEVEFRTLLYYEVR
jgi:hypothetical protein